MAQNNPNLKWTRLAAAVALGLCTGLATIAYSPSAAAQTSEARRYDLKAGTLDEALSQFGLQSGLQILAPPELVSGHRAQAVSGDLTSTQVLERLLRGTGLSYERINANTIVIKRRNGVTQQEMNSAERSERSNDQKNSSATSSEVAELAPVVVTGSHIRGTQPAAPIIVLSAEQMRREGYNDVGEAMRALPQNFSGGQNPGVRPGAAGANPSNANQTGASSINLRGLGVDATLTLLNGQRLPYDGIFQATDVSNIPISAIDRIEVLLDGASATYGSDAIAGVVNIILKRDYEGLEFSGRYGAATGGGLDQYEFTALMGKTWGSGGFLLTGNFSRTNALRAGDVDELDYLADQSVYISPPSTVRSALVSGHQMLSDRIELGLDAFVSHRQQDTRDFYGTSLATQDAHAKTWGLAPRLTVQLPDDWFLRADAFLSKSEVRQVQRGFDLLGVQTYEANACICQGSDNLSLQAEGPLINLPAGQVRVALGVGRRHGDFAYWQTLATPEPFYADRTSMYQFAELNVPVVSPEQGVPGVSRLDFNAAVRREDYGDDSFGEVVTPKLGAIWAVSSQFELKASWGKSFKAPTFYEQYFPPRLIHYPAAALGGTAAPAATLLLLYGQPDLAPERSEIITAGFVVKPVAIPGLRLEFNLFTIDYTDRVVVPYSNFGQILRDGAEPYVIRNPTQAQQDAIFEAIGLPIGTFTPGENYVGPYVPENIVAVIDDRYVNASSQHTEGVDLAMQYQTGLFGGSLTLNANGTWLDSSRRVLASLPETPTVGYAYFPARVRGRAGGNWWRDGLTLSAHLNYIDGLKDPGAIPVVERGSMTTVDVSANYHFEGGFLGDAEVNVSVINLFNRYPPYFQPVQPYYVNYDSTNYDARGRTVNLTVTKRF